MKDYKDIKLELVEDLLLDKTMRSLEVDWKECVSSINIGNYHINRLFELKPCG